MAFSIKIAVSFALFLIVLTKLQPLALTISAPQVPCLFIFGDSLVDNGNNNQLTTSAKANYPPYGIDFPQGPTGRFTNGRTIADVLAELLGFDTYIPPFATAQGEDIIKGVNYGSGGSGIRYETGQQLGDRISLDKQLLNHNLTISHIANFLGSDISAKEHLGKCLYYFVIGNNDYLNNYFIPEYYNTSNIYTPDEYAMVLVQQYSQQLKTLYEFGARKISISGLGPLGCVPAEWAKGTEGSACVDWMNEAIQLFNDKLKVLVSDLNNNLTDSNFVYVSAMDFRPTQLFALGYRIMRKKCCKVSNITGLCLSGQNPCPIRALHFFYDSFHPTEIVNEIVATASYSDILKLI